MVALEMRGSVSQAFELRFPRFLEVSHKKGVSLRLRRLSGFLPEEESGNSLGSWVARSRVERPSRKTSCESPRLFPWRLCQTHLTLQPQRVKSSKPGFPAAGPSAASLAQLDSPRSRRSLIGSSTEESRGSSAGLSWSWAGKAGSRSVPCDSQLPPVTSRLLLCECVHSPQSAGQVRQPGPFNQTAWPPVPAYGHKLPVGLQIGNRCGFTLLQKVSSQFGSQI